MMFPQNFSTIGHPQAELHAFKLEKLDACIRPLLQIWSHIVLKKYKLYDVSPIAYNDVEVINYIL